LDAGAEVAALAGAAATTDALPVFPALRGLQGGEVELVSHCRPSRGAGPSEACLRRPGRRRAPRSSRSCRAPARGACRDASGSGRSGYEPGLSGLSPWSLARGTSRFPGAPPLVRFGDRRLRRLLRQYRMLIRQNLADREASCPRDLVGAAQSLQPVHRRLRHVDRVRRAEALREDVADPGELQDGTDPAAGDDAGSLARGAQEHTGRVGASQDLVRDRRSVLRNGEEVLLRVVDRLRDRERDLTSLAVADADTVDLVTDDDERGEREPPAALDDLRDTVDLDHALLELAGLFALDHGALDARELGSSAQAVTFRSDRVLWPRKASQARTQGA